MSSRTLDHVVVAVEDLENAGAAFEAFGFQVTPRSDHPFGTSNRLIMLPDVYVELTSVTDPGSLPDEGFARFVADTLASGRSGPVMLALRTDDPAADQRRLRANGLPSPDPIRFGRWATLPDGDRRWVEFVSLFTDLGSDRVSAFYCQHLTRELVWHPATLEHPNGATGLTEVTVADPGREAWAILAFMAELDPTPQLTLGTATIRTGSPGLGFRADRQASADWGQMSLTLARA